MPRPRNADRTWDHPILLLLLAGAALVPLVVSFSGADHFRLPKELLLYVVVILATAATGIALVLQKVSIDWRALRVPLALAGAGLGWGILTTLTSTHRALSIEALIWGTALVVLFLLTAIFAGRGNLDLIAAAVLFPAVVNSAVVILQAARIWNPWVFPTTVDRRLTHNALLGNADIVGAYLAAPLLFAAALALVTPGRRRAIYALVAAFIGAGILASQTLTAIIALAASVLALLVFWRPRLGVVFAVVGVLLLAGVLLAYPAMRKRLAYVVEGVRTRHWSQVLTGRTIPFAAAWAMFADRPLVGMGPGTFKYHYMQYQVKLRDERPALFARPHGVVMNFGEAHNDHLQALAEIGLPGYLLFLAGIGYVASRSRVRRPDDPRARLGALLAAPFAVLLLVMMIAQFGFQVAAPAYAYVFLTGACVAWTLETTRETTTRSDDPA